MNTEKETPNFLKNVKNYNLFFKIGIKNTMHYKISLIMNVLFTFFIVVFLFYFWKTIGEAGVSFVDNKFIFYIIVAFGVGTTLSLNWMFINVIKSRGGTAVKDLTYLLLRRISPFSYDAKNRAWSFVSFVLMLIFLFVFNAIVDFYPIDYFRIVPFALFMAVSYFIVSYLSLIVSYFAFWFDEAWAFGYSVMMIVSFASGGMLPLYIMPQWLQSILTVLPFQYLVYVPTRILIEDFSLSQYFLMFGVGIFWAVFLGFVNSAAYKIGLGKFESQGG